MNKAELVAEIQARVGPECSRAHAERVLAAFVGAVEAGLRRDGEDPIAGLGAFAVRERKPRTGRNPVTGAPLAIPGSTTVGFRPGAALKDVVREPHA